MFDVQRNAHSHRNIHFVLLNPQSKEENSKPVRGFNEGLAVLI
jgi:hypothetical protein